jgi:phosphoenolpyruvate carboxykinase (GTP)
METLFEVNKAEWEKEAAGIETFYAQFGDRLPQALKKKLAELKARLSG